MKPFILIILGTTVIGLVGYFTFSTQPDSDTLAPVYDGQPALPASKNGMVSDHSGTVFNELSVPIDCSNECTAFPQASDQYTYCRSVCGLSPVDPDHPELPSPSIDPSLDQMIRQKDEAIKNRDLAACRTIPDDNLRTACEVRVTEDLLE